MNSNQKQPDESKINYLKCFDSKELECNCEGDSEEVKVKTGKNEEIKTCCPSALRKHIEPWLTSLFQSEHLSLLVGSGLSYAVQGIASEGTDNKDNFNFSATDGLEDKWDCLSDLLPKENYGCGLQGLEGRIRDAYCLISGLEVLGGAGKKGIEVANQKVVLSSEMLEKCKVALDEVMRGLAQNVLAGEKVLNNEELWQKQREKVEAAHLYLIRFLMSFASRTGTRERLHIFTTNYDRFIERGADLAGLRLLDRFIGGLSPVFRSSRLDVDMHYNPPGIRGEPRYVEGVAKFTKLHGSLDWIEPKVGGKPSGNIIRAGVPFGASDIELYTKGFGNSGVDGVMIYPNSSKDRETAEYPYVDLFRDFAAAICRPNHTLVCYGYGFGDEHINRVIDDMLTISSTHLVVISLNDDCKQEKWDRMPHVTYLMGLDLADLRKLSDNYLPKPAIDFNVKRMADLLQTRMFADGRLNNNASSPGDQKK